MQDNSRHLYGQAICILLNATFLLIENYADHFLYIMSICALEILLLLTSFIITVNCMPDLDPKFNCCHLTSTCKIFMIICY